MQQKSTIDNQNQNNLRLWRKVNSKPTAQDEKSTEKSEVKTFNAELKSEAILQNGSKYESDITQFLLRVHHRMSNEGQDSESEILQRLSLEWPDESFHKTQSIHCDRRLIFSEQISILNQGWKTQRNVGSELDSLKEIKNLVELQAYVSKLNPLVAEQLQDLMKDHEKLSEECNCSRYNDKKTTLKLQLLNNQIHMLDKKNEELTNENQKLKQELQGLKSRKAYLIPQPNIETCRNDQQMRQSDKGEEKQDNRAELNPPSVIQADSESNVNLLDELDVLESIELQKNSSVSSVRSNQFPTLSKQDFNSLASQIFGVPKKSIRSPRKK